MSAQAFNRLRSAGLHLAIALLLAALIVAMPLGVILFWIPWLAIVAWAWKSEDKYCRGGLTVMIYVLTTAIVVILALLAPVKTVEGVLDRPIKLPHTKVSIADLADQENLRTWLPLYVHVRVPEEGSDKTIHFRSQDITLREFVDTIEQQTELRHRFRHCGNGSSILYGGDCSFGLSLR